MKTTLLVKQANCPACFNDTLEHLGRLEGVRAVHGSVTGPCIEIDHDHIAPSLLAAVVRDRLHGIEMYANEVRMVPLEPIAERGPCPHHQGA